MMMMMMMVALVRAGMPLAVPCFALTFDEALTTRLSFRWVLLYMCVWMWCGCCLEGGRMGKRGERCVTFCWGWPTAGNNNIILRFLAVGKRRCEVLQPPAFFLK